MVIVLAKYMAIRKRNPENYLFCNMYGEMLTENVLRYTTFFHQFTLMFDELKQEKYVDWYGYSSSVSPYILEQIEKEAGYKFRPEFIVDQGAYNNQYRVPGKEFPEYIDYVEPV